MQSSAKSPAQYMAELPEERKEAMTKLRNTILENLPKGFEEEMGYGNLGYVVPHSLYPSGYHCTPNLPLPFMGIASQKNFIAFYHMGIYANEDLMNWFVQTYKDKYSYKLDMGKSCIRFKKIEQIPFDILGELVQKVTPEDWISTYESKFKRSK